MAYAALVFLEQELQRIMLNHHDCIRLYGKEGLESLYSNVIFLEKFLEDFSGSSSSMIKKLESRITDVAYEASDIFARGITHRSWRYKSTIKSCIKKVCSRVEEAKEIRKVLEMKANILGHDSSITSSSSTVAVPSGKDTMVGLVTDLSQMKERIVGRNSALQIIPITGMGGIGKTTLAKSVYEDPTIKAHFDVLSWVTVSQEHNTEKILEEILGDTEPKDKEPLIVRVHKKLSGRRFLGDTEPKDNGRTLDGEAEPEPLIVRVHKKLSGRRFLIIMDDIWSVKAWDSVRNAFPDDKKGSRVVITTRLIEVATNVGSSSPLHEMQLMNEVQSWELFQKEAFGQEYCPSQLKKIGKTISTSCKGLPLAIVVIARLLKLNRTEDYWENFVRNMHEAVSKATRDNQIMKILSLSYDNLPPHLKACFLYMGTFPEDANIPTEKLKWLWVAEGFLKPTTNKSVEEVAEKCLLDLVDRNLLSVGKRSSNGRIRNCTLHDLLRDLSLKKAIAEKFSKQIITTKDWTRTPCFTSTLFQRHMVYRRCVDVSTPAILRFFGVNKIKHGYVYSLICHRRINYKDMLLTMKSKVVRVVDVLGAPIHRSMSFGVNLRYFAFVYSGGSGDLNATLEQVRKLQNLETLIISHDVFCGTLYFPILEMPKLKHFVVNTRYSLRHRALAITQSKERKCSLAERWSSYCLIDNRNSSVSNKSLLKTLSGVHGFKLTVDATETLANLVKLKIQYNEYIIDSVCLNNLVYLHQLEELNIDMDYGYIQLPTNIAFPGKLKKITFWFMNISWETMSVLGSLPNLQVLKVTECKYESDEWEPVEGKFQQLKYLKLGVLNLKEWKVESTHFPCLEQLIFLGCSKLKELPAEVGEINTLEKLAVHYCDRCVGDSAREIQEEQQRYGNYQLRVFVENENPW